MSVERAIAILILVIVVIVIVVFAFRVLDEAVVVMPR